MNIVDERDKIKQTIFDDLRVGDCFVDEIGDICIKTGEESCIYSTDDESWDSCIMTGKEKVFRLEATLTIRKKI